MAIYNYVATDSSGGRRTGTVDARTEELALTLLKTQGLYVVNLSVKRTNILDSLTDIIGIPNEEVVNFTRQFSTMISAGLPLSRALEVLSDQTTNGKMKKVLTDILRDVEGGSPLSVSMGKYPKVFPRTYQALIKAGESSGKLDEILKKLAQTMEANRELRSRFKAAMVYPIIVFMAMIGVFVLMMIFVIPKLVVKRFHNQLPVLQCVTGTDRF
jgi:type IV pilus assembly protein PilC